MRSQDSGRQMAVRLAGGWTAVNILLNASRGRVPDTREALENMLSKVCERACDFLSASYAEVFLYARGEPPVLGRYGHHDQDLESAEDFLERKRHVATTILIREPIVIHRGLVGLFTALCEREGAEFSSYHLRVVKALSGILGMFCDESLFGHQLRLGRATELDGCVGHLRSYVEYLGMLDDIQRLTREKHSPEALVDQAFERLAIGLDADVASLKRDSGNAWREHRVWGLDIELHTALRQTLDKQGELLRTMEEPISIPLRRDEDREVTGGLIDCLLAAMLKIGNHGGRLLVFARKSGNHPFERPEAKALEIAWTMLSHALLLSEGKVVQKGRYTRSG